MQKVLKRGSSCAHLRGFYSLWRGFNDVSQLRGFNRVLRNFLLFSVVSTLLSLISGSDKIHFPVGSTAYSSAWDRRCSLSCWFDGFSFAWSQRGYEVCGFSIRFDLIFPIFCCMPLHLILLIHLLVLSFNVPKTYVLSVLLLIIIYHE